MEEIKTAAIYARFSSSNQREESIDAQLRVCNRYAADNGYTVVKEYTDSAISGRTDQRPAFQRMIHDSAKGEFSTLLIYSHDRFSRNKYDTANYKNRLRKNGVRIISVTMPLDDSPESGLMESIMEGFAQYYSENLSRSCKRGLEENALHCKSNGATPYGYTVKDGYYVPDQVQSKAVKMIFEMYVDGYGKKEICKKLEEDGYRTRAGNTFKVNSLHAILTNERYKGVYKYNGIRKEHGMEPIIDEELFDQAQKQIEKRKYRRGGGKATEEYLLSGKLFCGHCGKPMIGESGTSSTGTVYHYYKCVTRKKKPGSCLKRTERKDELENLVLEFICNNVLTDEMIDEIAEREYALLNEEAADKSLLISLEAEYKDVSNKIENMLEAIENGIITPKTKERLLDLEQRQSDLEARIIKEKLKKPEFTKDHIIFWLNKFRSGDIKDFDYKRAVINTLVNSVFIYDEPGEDGGHKKIVIALNLKNSSAKMLTSSDVNQMVIHFTRSTNFIILRYFVVFLLKV